MKIKLAVSDESREEAERFLMERGIEIDDNANFILIEKDRYPQHLAVRDPQTNEKLHLSASEIVTVESYGKIVEVHTENAVYHTTDRLYQLMNLLDPSYFLRISNSVIVAKRKIKEIKPTLSMKFILIMSNDERVDVTRSYYHSFKEVFHI